MYYVLILMALVLLCWNKDATYKNYRVFAKFFLLLIFFVGFFRDTTIGTDIALYDDGYYDVWRKLFDYPRDIEPGFMALTSVIKAIFPSYFLYYGILFLLNIYFYCKAVKFLGINKFLFIAILLLGGLLAPSFNVIRQMLALSIGLFLYAYILDLYKKKKLKPFYALLLYEASILLGAFLFHKTLFILAIVPIFHVDVVKKVLDNDLLLWGMLALAIFVNTVGNDYVRIAIAITEGMFGERGDFWANNYLTYADYAEATHGYMTTVINGSIAILLSRKQRDSLFFVGYLGLLLGGIAADSLSTIGRLFDNLSIFLLLYWSKYWFEFNKGNRVFLINNGLKALRVLFWLTSLYFTLLTNESLTPYRTYLFQ